MQLFWENVEGSALERNFAFGKETKVKNHSSQFLSSGV